VLDNVPVPVQAKELGSGSASGLRAFSCTQGSFDRAALDGTQYLGYNPLLRFGAGEGDAGLTTMNDSQSPASVPHKVTSPLVVGVQHAATPAASQDTG
jgi:hypothetical protein